MFLPPAPVLIWSETLPPLGQGASGTPVLAAGAIYTSPWIPVGANVFIGYGVVGVDDTGSATLVVEINNDGDFSPDVTSPIVDIPAGGGGSPVAIVTNNPGQKALYARLSVTNEEGDVDIFALSLSLFALPELSSSNGGTPLTGDDWPISNDLDAGAVVTVTPDPIAGGGEQRWVPFAGQASAIAWGLNGDAFPRVVFGSDPANQGLLFIGDGTFDPTAHASINFTDSINRPGIGFLAGLGQTGPVLGIRALTVLGATDPNTAGTPGDGGDVVISENYLGVTVVGTTYWTVDSPGNPAVWDPFLTFTGTDPITAGAVPIALSQLWLDAGGGGVWTSTGAALGDWVKLVGTDTGWIDMVLLNGWTDVSGWARYRKINGVVYVQVSADSGTAAQIATLPAGFRPGEAVFSAAPSDSPPNLATLSVNAGGDVSGEALGGGVADNILGGTVSFPADA